MGKRAQGEMVGARVRKFPVKYSDVRLFGGAGLLGFGIKLAVMEIATGYSAPLASLTTLLPAIGGGLFFICLVGWLKNHRKAQTLTAYNKHVDIALNNMIQGLSMFDGQNRLVVWNRRYQTMYNIDPQRIWAGCSVRDLFEARKAAGTFPHDPEAYEFELRSAIDQGKPFAQKIELPNGRIIAIVNTPTKDGGWVATHDDITERERSNRELEHTRSFLDTIIENVPSPIIVKDVPELRYRLVNRAAGKFLGVDRVAMLGKTVAEVFPKGNVTIIESEDRKLIESGRTVFIDEHALVTPGNGTRIVTSTRLPVTGADGKPQYLISVIHDVTERKRHEQRIAHMTHHDSLTDLPNRAAFNSCLAATLELAAKSGESFAVLSMDVDRFKAVNDVFGHAIGDELLREVARRMEIACQGSFLARVGGDEFIAITPTAPQPATAEALAARINGAFTSDIDIEGHPLRVGLTIGIGVYPQDGADTTTLVANADAALFRAKSEARGSIRFFEMSMDKQLREKRALQQDLRTAVMHDELALHYQPQARIDGEITGFEALARWNHPRHGLVPPSTFIPLAEENGIIGALGEWVLRSACREAASWPRPLSIAINLSPVQFQSGDLPNLVHQILLETGLSPKRLELEITEGVLIGDFTRAVATLRRLKNLGVRIAMDDFGTGYSSLSYLQSFPFDKIKIDQAFISNLGNSQQAATIVRAVIALGRGLDVPVAAEGVETEEQLKFLAAEKCDEIQGYLIGRPKPIAEYAELVGRPPVPSKPKLKMVAANG
jgi:diguanylate cyclase (GGDEF)-like protein/PAS domain S-box-containing protein